MSEISELEKALEKFRGQLLRNERAAASEMVRVYGEAWKRIKAELERLHTEYEQAKALGGKPDADWIFRYNRSGAFRDQVEQELLRFAQYAEQSTREQMKEAIRAAEEHAERLARAALGKPPAGLVVDWNRVPTAAVAEMVGLTQPDSPLHKLFMGITAERARDAENALIRGLLMGKNPRETAPLLRQVLGVTLSRALRIARTETLRAYREATRQNYQANNDIVKGWVWHSALDVRTCAVCWAMHGTVHRLDERLDDHPNGRCAMVPQTATWDEIGKKHGIDLSGIPETNPHIEPGIEVFEKLPADKQLKILGQAKYSAWKDGKFTLSDLVGRKRSAVWGTYRYERSLEELGINYRDYIAKSAEPSGVDAVLAQIENEIVTQSYETAFVLDANGNVIIKKSGSKDTVSFTDDEVSKMFDMILTHNHPGGWDYPKSDARRNGNSLSPADIMLAANAGLKEIRAISPGYLHSMKSAEGKWPPLSVVEEALNHLDAEVKLEVYEKIKDGKMTIVQAEAEHWHEIMTRFANMFANMFGLKYNRIRR